MKLLKESQKTHVPTAKELEKKWYLIDLNGKTLGPAAAKIADVLRGKGKPFFTPQLDSGDFVVAIHARGIRLARNKMDTKLYQWHTRYPGGLRTRTAREISATKPEKIIYDAVWGMLPRNKLRRKLIKKLHIYPMESHDHAAQSPQQIQF